MRNSCKECIFFNKRYKDYKVLYTKTEPKVPIIVLNDREGDCGRSDKQTEVDRRV